MVRRNSSQRGVVKESVKVDAPISSLPKHLHDDVRKYIRRAGDLSVNPNRVLICACLLVAAERREECHLPKGKYVSTVQWGQLAAMLGLSDEESENHGEVAKRYKRLRQAMQQIHAAIGAVRQRSKNLLALLERYHALLPEPHRYLADDVRKQANTLDQLIYQLLVATYQSKESLLDRRRPKEIPHELFNVGQQALIWWQYCLHRVCGPRGKIWADIYELAVAWRLTDCSDVEELKRVVVRLTEEMTEIVTPPQWCLKLCLPET